MEPGNAWPGGGIQLELVHEAVRLMAEKKDKRTWTQHINSPRQRSSNTLRIPSEDGHSRVVHGCEGTEQPDGKLKFERGMNMYNYDGNYLLSFDDTNQVWVCPVLAAEPTKRKWDNVQVLKEYTKGYLENKCIEWLSKFKDYFKNKTKTAKPPEVFVFANKAKIDTNIILNCLATGSYPKDIIMTIQRNGRILGPKHGLKSSGVRPNEDDNFQRRDQVEIPKSDQSTYTCEVRYLATNFSYLKTWDRALPPDSDSDSGSTGCTLPVIGAVFGVPVVGAMVFVVLYRKGIIRSRCSGNKSDLSTSGSGEGNQPLDYHYIVIPVGGSRRLEVLGI
ncbi:HLA class I histocompatibility antigen, B alpha chain-like [Pholidichthys leucotaenia]